MRFTLTITVFCLTLSSSAQKFEVVGVNSETAVYGTSPNGIGVVGLSTSSTGVNYGGYFESAGETGRAVFGLATQTSGLNYGGYFKAKGIDGRGVYGISTNQNGTNYGGYFESAGETGRAVFGLATQTSGLNYGGYFKAKGIGGRGVYGEASDVNGTNYGGYFLSKSIEGRAVFGLADYVDGASNYGGWFKGKGTSGGTGVYAWGNKYDFYADGPGMDYGSSSSIRWKSNVRNIINPIDIVSQIRGVRFTWNQDHGGHDDIGFIAEEVGVILPEIVEYEDNGIDAVGMDYTKIAPLLVEVAKAMRNEYQKRLQAQQFEIESLKLELAVLRELKEEVAELKAMILPSRSTED